LYLETLGPAIREGGLQIRDPQLFNCLPVNIRGQTGCTLTGFKHNPDKPKIPGYTIEIDTNPITSMRNSRKC